MPDQAALPQWAAEYEQHRNADWAPTRLAPEEEQAFRQWLVGTKLYQSLKQQIAEEAGIPADQLDENRVIEMVAGRPDGDYDYRGAWRGKVQEEISPHDGLPHWPSRTEDGAWLKSPAHPTAWKEFFMSSTGVDPDDAGVGEYDAAVAATRDPQAVKAMQQAAQQRMWDEEAKKRGR